MKLIVLIIFSFLPVHIQPQTTPLEEVEYNPWLKENEVKNVQNGPPKANQDTDYDYYDYNDSTPPPTQTPEEEAREIVQLYKQALEKAKEELAKAKERLDAILLEKQNYTNKFEEQNAKIQELERNLSKLETDLQTCKNEIEQYANEIKRKNATNYQQEIDTIQKRIQEVLREKNDKMLLTQKQNEEEKAALDRLNDAKSKLNKLKSEKESLLQQIDKCQMVLKNCNSTIPQSPTLSAPTCFLNNLIDFKSSLFNNLLSGLFGLDRKMN